MVPKLELKEIRKSLELFGIKNYGRILEGSCGIKENGTGNAIIKLKELFRIKNHARVIWTRTPDRTSGRQTRPEFDGWGDFVILEKIQWLSNVIRGIVVPNLELIKSF